ncbi:hypothetical protein ebA3318 [Aromatoleum aromaticum EbN1]|uniref:Uncharacterized protein n=1 Tax=Aromatoleum aromaticum (strain DSM 19018 / LMG 30748 / EbN1) TaxID=76114 RepID=Q5P3W9_AROAE|nr:hypothetical protein ebA3318 [Aromatoleum aromaticum EbN1]
MFFSQRFYEQLTRSSADCGPFIHNKSYNALAPICSAPLPLANSHYLAGVVLADPQRAPRRPFQ